ncbi:unnamed protein product [Strongylus vulgaris]|uniref:Uncharacterized protein n=1 Tax=Strongylus vulgaris TaxID=40348 RepID=A0A3P7LAP4_STRVU|nr:unnamed protein product [Strongylus vulgaris]
MVESPSTATLRQRRQPFIRIEYAIQISLGNIVFLEAPITIGELSTHDSSNVLKPFVAGPQPIEEVDETQRIAIGGPFMYTPVYTMKLNPSNEAKPTSDGVPRQGPTKPVTEETVTERTELLKHNASDNEPADVAVTNADVSQHQEQHETEQVAQQDVAETADENTDSSPATAQNADTVEGEETTVITEITKDNGTNVIRTTTKTKHLDGSESTMVQIHTTTASITIED